MSIVRDFLREKDKDYGKYIPQVYNMTEDEKKRNLFLNNYRLKFQIDTVAKCIKPCFKYMQSPMVAENESECMNNCAQKGLEILSLFELHNEGG